MGRKNVIGIDRIQSAALAVFMEKGYDGASMRDIAQRADCSVGLAYNYYQTKDEVFAGAMELFFSKYEKDFEKIVVEGERNPFQMMTSFFSYMVSETKKFREKFADKLHWTVRWAIREKTLSIIEPYIQRMIQILMSWGAKPPLEMEVTSSLLAHGIGGMILHTPEEDYEKKRDGLLRGTNLIMGLSGEWSGLLIPFFVCEEDAAGCAERMQEVMEFHTPHKAEFLQEFSDRIKKKEILVMRREGRVVAAIAFSKNQKKIQWMAVQSEFKNRGIEMRLLVTALSQFDVGEEISVSLCNHDQPGEKTMLDFFLAMGFEKREEKSCCRLVKKVPQTAKEIVAARDN